ncbi:MAG: head-tail connector protein [Synergistaceae bacterium]|nr:head-tail connector protein [Synergistaceae bacterium]
MDERILKKAVEKRFLNMMCERNKQEPRWREQALQFAPNRGRFSITDEEKRDEIRKNSIPRSIADEFAAGLGSGVMSASIAWFTLTVFEPQLGESEAVKAYLSDATEEMLAVMIRSNLYDEAFSTFKEVGIFGTGCLLVEEDDEEVFRCRAYTVGQYAIEHDRMKKVNRFCHTLKYTLEELAIEFGEEKLPMEMRRKLHMAETFEHISNESYEVHHLIEENTEYVPDAEGQREMRYRSLYWLPGTREPEFLRITGYHEFPVMVPRWRLVGEDLYGSENPGALALDDAKTIQDIETDERTAIELKVSPALLLPNTLANGSIDMRAGGVTFYTPGPDGAPVITPLFQVNFDHKAAAEKIEALRICLEKAFYIDLFRMWSADLRQGRTATEIQAREEEKVYALEPILTRLMYDFLDPLVLRIYAIMERRKLLPEPPEELDDQPYRIEYTSVLAKTQKRTSQLGLDTLLGVGQRIAELQMTVGERPSILDNFDFDTILGLVSDMHGVPAGAILGKDKVNALRVKKQEAEQQQQAAQTEAAAVQEAPQLAKTAKDLGQTPMNGGQTNALDVLQGMAAGALPN